MGTFSSYETMFAFQIILYSPPRCHHKEGKINENISLDNMFSRL